LLAAAIQWLEMPYGTKAAIIFNFIGLLLLLIKAKYYVRPKE